MTNRLIQAILFDLDGTLTDYKASSLSGLRAAFKVLQSAFPDVTFDRFESEYNQVIASEFPRTSQHGIRSSAFENRKTRFRNALRKLGIDDDKLITLMADSYGNGRAEGAVLNPGVMETLEYFKEKYDLGLVTEGSEQTQSAQLSQNNLTPFFKAIIISGATPYHKPDPELFLLAADSLEAPPGKILMVGDRVDWDLAPAKKVGMKTVLFSPETDIRDVSDNSLIDYRISHFTQLMDLDF